MAQKANLKGAKSARDSFGPLYNRIVAGKLGGDDAAGSLASSPAKGSSLKRKGLLESGDVAEDDDEDEVASPLKKTKKAAAPSSRKGKGKKGRKVEELGVFDDGEEVEGDTVVVKAEVLDDDAGQEI